MIETIILLAVLWTAVMNTLMLILIIKRRGQ